MNTEINFLEKRPKKYTAPLLFILLFLMLLGVISALLIYQQNMYSSAISNEQERIYQVEVLLQEHSEEAATVQQLQSIQQAIDSVESQIVPNVALYHNVRQLLGEEEEFIRFVYNGGDELVIEGIFDDLESVANYVGVLLEQNYVVDAGLSSVNGSEEVSYQATLALQVNVNALREELDEE